MADLAKTTTTIDFSLSCDESSDGFSLELDDDLNGGITEFAPGDDIYIRCYPGNFNPQYSTTLGTLTVHSTNIEEDIVDEYLVFGRSNSANLSKYCKRIGDWSWCGREGPSFTLNGLDEIKLSEDKVSGILKISYNSCYDVLKLKTSVACQALVEAYLEDASNIGRGLSGEMYGNITIDLTDEGDEREVYITVKDACTRSILPNAEVYIGSPQLGESSVFVANVYVGLTNSAGRISLGVLRTGRKYPIRVVKAGYQDTDLDRIQNDYIDLTES